MRDKVVVTGGAGFIGSHIVHALVSHDAGFGSRGDKVEVHVIDNFSSGKREERLNSRARYHNIDIRDYDGIMPILAEAKFVFHEAALPRVQYSLQFPQETFSVNVNGTVAVLRAAHSGGVKRVIYAASSSAYGDPERLPLSEDMPARPKSPYGLQKYVGELACRLWREVYGLETVSLRYFNVYGPGFDPQGEYALVIGKFIKQSLEKRPLTITGDGTQTRDFTHVRDVVRANLLAAQSPHVGGGEVINIGAGRNVSINRLAELFGGDRVHIKPRLEPHDTRADVRRAKELLGWEPKVTLEEGVGELKKVFNLA